MVKDIKLNDINEIYLQKCNLEKEGYTFLGASDGLNYVFKKGNDQIILKVPYKSYKTQSFSYENSMVNIVDTIKKYYGLQVHVSTIKRLENKLNKLKPDHIVFFILDGLGNNIIQNSLEKDEFLRKNVFLKITASYPSTTACAIPLSKSGLLPIESGWIGWQNYFEEEKRHLVMFTGEDYYT